MWPSLSLIPFCILAGNPWDSPADSYIFLQTLHLRSTVRLGGHLQPHSRATLIAPFPKNCGAEGGTREKLMRAQGHKGASKPLEALHAAGILRRTRRRVRAALPSTHDEPLSFPRARESARAHLASCPQKAGGRQEEAQSCHPCPGQQISAPWTDNRCTDF